MKLGTITDLRFAIGKKPDGQPIVSYSWASALKKAAGFSGRFFDIDAVKAWWRENPNFKISDAWACRKKKKKASKA